MVGLELKDGLVTSVQTPTVYRNHYVVNAGGRCSDEIAAMVGQDDFRIVPRKGEYYVFDKRFGYMVGCPLFPVPTAVSKGILVTPSVDGNLLIGPNAKIKKIRGFGYNTAGISGGVERSVGYDAGSSGKRCHYQFCRAAGGGETK